MFINSFNVVQFAGEPKQWKLTGLVLRDINLLVGKNASGKSKTLSAILTLSRLLTGEINVNNLFGSTEIDVLFDDDGVQHRYRLKYTNGSVLEESFASDARSWLERGTGGIGKLFAQKVNQGKGEFMDFQTPQHELAAVARRDSIQHPFFESLYQWADGLRYFPFGTSLGKDMLTFVVKDKALAQPFNEKETNKIIPMFRSGLTRFGDPFKDSIKADMAAIGYPIEDIGSMPPTSITVITDPALAAEPTLLSVKEAGLSAMTDQFEMSQGMYRALAVIINLNFAQFTAKPNTILIDDIGEGLDFERSCALIDLVMRKANVTRSQLIMATNDRFIMNKVPLESWTVLNRDNNLISIYNYNNSRIIFDDFKFTGLNNFDFFATDFLHNSDVTSGAASR